MTLQTKLGKMLMIMYHIALRTHALHHNVHSSCMARFSDRPHVRGAGTRGVDEASSSRRLH
jgi:hypothetical protein